jgi:hypothetical protein
MKIEKLTLVPVTKDNQKCSLGPQTSKDQLTICNYFERRLARHRLRLPQALFAATLVAAALAPRISRACACGCGIFDVATSSMFPEGPGGMAYLEYDYQDQDRNWSGNSQAPAANNPDKDIRTHFITAGVQYMFNSRWGLQAELPYDVRHFETTGGASGSDRVALNWSGLGDIRVEGIYTGFSPDLSSGVTFGFKLPTGDFSHNDAFGDIDRDTELGTGSTDILLGGFHRQSLTRDHRWTGFAQALLDVPVLIQDEYRPGVELDAAAGIYYKGWTVGGVGITPVAQVIGSERTSDSGSASAHPVASGYQRVLLSPGIELDVHPFRVYADVELPVYQNFTGNQVAAPALFKLVVSYMF